MKTLAIFCKVVDNFGDIGICWRLARQIRQEHALAVTLWVDDLKSFQRICPEVATDAAIQEVTGVRICHWRDQGGIFSAADVADIVIEFFGCDIPPGYVAAMAECRPRPVWLNLEGLSAEEWVEGCHTLPSPHPRMPLTKHFFFPGFTGRTGGLLHEGALEERRLEFQSNPAAMADFLGRFGVTPPEMASLKVSLFCYPHAPVSALFDVWSRGVAAITCLVPEGVASEAVSAFLGVNDARAGVAGTRGALTIRVLPFVPQADYDKLLWACDINFVRGEDSFVRAQWAGKPFVWHIYPQDNNLHHVKLRAFLQQYCADIESLEVFSLCWNGVTDEGVEGQAALADFWNALCADMPTMRGQTEEWCQKMLGNGDLASNLLKFAESIRSDALKNGV